MVYKPLRQWVEQEYNIFCREYLEGDDILGILATSKVIIKNTNKIIVSLDKDMKTLPCKYHNNRNDERDDKESFGHGGLVHRLLLCHGVH